MPLQNDFESSIKNITVDLADSGVPRATLMAMQGDKGTRFARITVLNGGHPVDLTNVYAVLRGVKKDGTTIFNGCEIENNKIIAELTQNILSVDGIGRYEIALYKADPTVEIKAITYYDLNPIIVRNTGFGISQNGEFMSDVNDSTIGVSLFMKVLFSGTPMLMRFHAQESNTDLTLDSIRVRDMYLGLEISNLTGYAISVDFYELNGASLWDGFRSSPSFVLQPTVQVVTPVVLSNMITDGELFTNLCTSDGGNVISSFPFTINVVKSSFDATEMENSNEWTVLNQAMQNLPMMSQLDEYVAEVHEAINDLDDIEGTVGDLSTDVTNVKGRVSTVEGLLNGHSVATSVPANAVFTDTTYSPANANNDGLMTSNQYTKLEGISSGAEVNQNAFSKVTVGSTEVNAAEEQDGIKFVAGSNVTITADTSTKEITIASSGGGGSIEPSQTNGNIIVNGSEMTVYDDTELQERTEIGEENETTGNPIDILVSYDQKPSSFIADFYPNQDMNGYPVPNYQGNGRNKLHLQNFSTQTVNDVTLTFNASTGTIELSGTSTYPYTTYIKLGPLLVNDGLVASTKYAFSGTQPNKGYYAWLELRENDDTAYIAGAEDTGSGVASYTVTSNTRLYLAIRGEANVNGIVLKPMAVLQSSGEPYKYNDFVPWTNECPIYTRAITSPTYVVEKIENGSRKGSLYINLSNVTNCGAWIDIKQNKAWIWKYLSSYNGETLPSIWISSRDEYKEGGTPTTGANVAYLDTTTEITPTVQKYEDADYDFIRANSTIYYAGLYTYTSDTNYPVHSESFDGYWCSYVDEHCNIAAVYQTGMFATIPMLDAYATKEYVDNAIITAINGSY